MQSLFSFQIKSFSLLFRLVCYMQRGPVSSFCMLDIYMEDV